MCLNPDESTETDALVNVADVASNLRDGNFIGECAKPCEPYTHYCSEFECDTVLVLDEGNRNLLVSDFQSMVQFALSYIATAAPFFGSTTGRLAVVAYGSSVVKVSDLSSDAVALARAVSAHTQPAGGRNTADALTLAQSILTNGKGACGRVVLVTTGVPDDSTKALNAAKKLNVTVIQVPADTLIASIQSLAQNKKAATPLSGFDDLLTYGTYLQKSCAIPPDVPEAPTDPISDCQALCQCDTILAIPASANIAVADFAKIKSAASTMLESFKGCLRSNDLGVGVGIVTYSNKVRITADVSGAYDTLNTALNSIYQHQTSGNGFEKVLLQAQSELLSDTAIYNSTKCKRIILIINGNSPSSSQSIAAARRIKLTGVSVAVLGINLDDDDEANAVASTNQYLAMSDYDDFNIYAKNLKLSCSNAWQCKDFKGRCDIVVVWDVSGDSVLHHQRFSKYFLDLVQRYMGVSGIRVGVVHFSADAATLSPITHAYDDIVQSVMLATPTLSTYVRNTWVGLRKAKDLFASSTASCKRVLLLSSGRTADLASTLDARDALAAAKIKTIVVGFDDASMDEISVVASAPLSMNAKLLPTDDDLDLLARTFEDSCFPPDNTTRTDTSPPVCKSLACDVIFVLDESGSITASQYTQAKAFLTTMSDAMANGLATGQASIGWVSFSDSSKTTVVIAPTTDLTAFQNAVKSRKQAQGGTETWAGLNMAKGLFDKLTSTRCKRIIVVTDGQSAKMATTVAAAQSIQRTGILITSVGVGPGAYKKELDGMATPPASENSITLTDYAALTTWAQSLQTTCNSPNYPCDPFKGCDVMFVWDSSVNHCQKKALAQSFISLSAHRLVGFGTRVGFAYGTDDSSFVALNANKADVLKVCDGDLDDAGNGNGCGKSCNCPNSQSCTSGNAKEHCQWTGSKCQEIPAGSCTGLDTTGNGCGKNCNCPTKSSCSGGSASKYCVWDDKKSTCSPRTGVVACQSSLCALTCDCDTAAACQAIPTCTFQSGMCKRATAVTMPQLCPSSTLKDWSSVSTRTVESDILAKAVHHLDLQATFCKKVIWIVEDSPGDLAVARARYAMDLPKIDLTIVAVGTKFTTTALTTLTSIANSPQQVLSFANWDNVLSFSNKIITSCITNAPVPSTITVSQVPIHTEAVPKLLPTANPSNVPMVTSAVSCACDIVLVLPTTCNLSFLSWLNMLAFAKNVILAALLQGSAVGIVTYDKIIGTLDVTDQLIPLLVDLENVWRCGDGRTGCCESRPHDALNKVLEMLDNDYLTRTNANKKCKSVITLIDAEPFPTNTTGLAAASSLVKLSHPEWGLIAVSVGKAVSSTTLSFFASSSSNIVTVDGYDKLTTDAVFKYCPSASQVGQAPKTKVTTPTTTTQSNSCQCDIMMVVDTSCSIANKDWPAVQQFMYDTIDRTQGLGTNVGLVTFDKFTNVFSPTMTTDRTTLKKNAQSIVKCTSGDKRNCCATRTYDGLLAAEKIVAAYESTEKKSPPNCKVLLVVTDGKPVPNPNNLAVVTAQQIRSRHPGWTIITVGVGKLVGYADLVGMASNPQFVISSPTFSILQNVEQILNKCPPPTTTTPPVSTAVEVTVCHKFGTSQQNTDVITTDGLQAGLNAGDALGACGDFFTGVCAVDKCVPKKIRVCDTTPIVVRLNILLWQFDQDAFIAQIAAANSVDPSQIKIVAVTEVTVAAQHRKFNVQDGSTSQASSTVVEVSFVVTDLSSENLASVVQDTQASIDSNPLLREVLNVTGSSSLLAPPTEPVTLPWEKQRYTYITPSTGVVTDRKSPVPSSQTPLIIGICIGIAMAAVVSGVYVAYSRRTSSQFHQIDDVGKAVPTHEDVENGTPPTPPSRNPLLNALR